MPMRGEISASIIRRNPFLQVREQRRSPWVSEIVFSSDFVVVAAFSTIGLLASCCLMLLPSFGNNIAALLAQLP
jgi:hypothetical protein